MIRSVYRSGWIRLRRFFELIHHDGSKKFNSTQLTWVGLDRVKPYGLDKFFFITIIIKLSKKYISQLSHELINKIHKLIFQLSCKQNMFNHPTELIKKKYK